MRLDTIKFLKKERKEGKLDKKKGRKEFVTKLKKGIENGAEIEIISKEDLRNVAVSENDLEKKLFDESGNPEFSREINKDFNKLLKLFAKKRLSKKVLESFLRKADEIRLDNSTYPDDNAKKEAYEKWLEEDTESWKKIELINITQVIKDILEDIKNQPDPKNYYELENWLKTIVGGQNFKEYKDNLNNSTDNTLELFTEPYLNEEFEKLFELWETSKINEKKFIKGIKKIKNWADGNSTPDEYEKWKNDSFFGRIENVKEIYDDEIENVKADSAKDNDRKKKEILNIQKEIFKYENKEEKYQDWKTNIENIKNGTDTSQEVELFDGGNEKEDSNLEYNKLLDLYINDKIDKDEYLKGLEKIKELNSGKIDIFQYREWRNQESEVEKIETKKERKEFIEKYKNNKVKLSTLYKFLKELDKVERNDNNDAAVKKVLDIKELVENKKENIILNEEKEPKYFDSGREQDFCNKELEELFDLYKKDIIDYRALNDFIDFLKEINNNSSGGITKEEYLELKKGWIKDQYDMENEPGTENWKWKKEAYWEEELTRLNNLFNQGVLTAEELKTEKKKIEDARQEIQNLNLDFNSLSLDERKRKESNISRIIEKYKENKNTNLNIDNLLDFRKKLIERGLSEVEIKEEIERRRKMMDVKQEEKIGEKNYNELFNKELKRREKYINDFLGENINLWTANKDEIEKKIAKKAIYDLWNKVKELKNQKGIVDHELIKKDSGYIELKNKISKIGVDINALEKVWEDMEEGIIRASTIESKAFDAFNNKIKYYELTSTTAMNQWIGDKKNEDREVGKKIQVKAESVNFEEREEKIKRAKELREIDKQIRELMKEEDELKKEYEDKNFFSKFFQNDKYYGKIEEVQKKIDKLMMEKREKLLTYLSQYKGEQIIKKSNGDDGEKEKLLIKSRENWKKKNSEYLDKQWEKTEINAERDRVVLYSEKIADSWRKIPKENKKAMFMIMGAMSAASTGGIPAIGVWGTAMLGGIVAGETTGWGIEQFYKKGIKNKELARDMEYQKEINNFIDHSNTVGMRVDAVDFEKTIKAWENGQLNLDKLVQKKDKVKAMGSVLATFFTSLGLRWNDVNILDAFNHNSGTPPETLHTPPQTQTPQTSSTQNYDFNSRWERPDFSLDNDHLYGQIDNSTSFNMEDLSGLQNIPNDHFLFNLNGNEIELPQTIEMGPHDMFETKILEFFAQHANEIKLSDGAPLSSLNEYQIQNIIENLKDSFGNDSPNKIFDTYELHGNYDNGNYGPTKINVEDLMSTLTDPNNHILDSDKLSNISEVNNLGVNITHKWTNLLQQYRHHN